MNRIKEKYKNYLYKYLGAEIFALESVKMDEVTESVFITLIDFYKDASLKIDSASYIEQLNNAFYRYKKLMNETVDSYINIYCDMNYISCEKTKYNEYLINNRKIINIEDGFIYIYKSLSKVSRRMRIVRTFVQDIKDTIKFR